MHIVIFSAQFYPHIGGVETYILSLSEQLILKGHSVTVVTSNNSNAASDESYKGIQILRLPCVSLLNGRFPIGKRNAEHRRLIKLLDSIPVDFILINCRFYLLSLLGVRYAARKNIKPVLIEHGSGFCEIDNPLLNKCGHAYEKLITSLIKRYCDDFYGVSKEASDWIKRFGIMSKGTLYTAINYELIQDILSDKTRADFLSQYPLDNNKIIITYTGRLIREKGVAELIDAVKLMENRDRVILMIAGDGSEADAFRQQAKDNSNIMFLGFISREKVIALLGKTDIFCLPSYYVEGFPLSVLEAAACGCLVIRTDSGGAEDQIPDETYGTILKDHHPQTIASALDGYVSNPERIRTCGQKLQQYVQTKYTWEKSVADLLEAFETANGN